MLKIAYCDDMESDRERILFALGQIEEKWQEKFAITSFSSGEDLCKNLITNHYNIILLDILMNGMDGIDTAKEIRAMGEDYLIIFISSYDKRVKELFDFRTVAFLDKPLQIDQLENALRRACEHMKKADEHIFQYLKNGQTHFVPMKQITYFSVRGHYVTIHTVKQKIEYKGKIREVWDKAKEWDCVCMPSRSFVVNIQYASISRQEIEISTSGEKIPIGSNYREDSITRFMNYLSRRGGNSIDSNAD